jgi:N-acetylglucosamine-6-sulfatase
VSAEHDQSARPNIVFVLIDDLRWDEIGVAGHPYIQTPNIDQVATTGAYFQNSFTTTALCSPSRASFLTGQYAHTNGITDNLARNEQSHRLNTCPKMLDAVGYDTAFIGKWHMGNDDTPRPGFDTWAVMKGQGEAINPEFNVDGERKQIQGYVTDILTDMATDFISKPRSDPFLLYVSHKALHPNITQLDDGSSVASPSGIAGFIAADRHDGMYSAAVQPRRPNFAVTPTDKPVLMRQIGNLPPLSSDTVTPDQIIQDRQEMLMAVDEGIGKILESLAKIGALDDTIIVVASDHGYWYGEHALYAERRLAYEEAIRIPLMMSYPRKIESGLRPVETVLSIDVAPTLLEYAGAEIENGIQGRSLMPVIEGTAENWRSSFLLEYYSDTVFERIENMGYKAVRTDRYKYIQYTDLDGMDELYDLQDDPYELKNIIDEGNAAEIIEEMKQELQRLLDEAS